MKRETPFRISADDSKFATGGWRAFELAFDELLHSAPRARAEDKEAIDQAADFASQVLFAAARMIDEVARKTANEMCDNETSSFKAFLAIMKSSDDNMQHSLMSIAKAETFRFLSKRLREQPEE
jgi:hypothetical protein